jgi:hypothetical protein
MASTGAMDGPVTSKTPEKEARAKDYGAIVFGLGGAR